MFQPSCYQGVIEAVAWEQDSNLKWHLDEAVQDNSWSPFSVSYCNKQQQACSETE